MFRSHLTPLSPASKRLRLSPRTAIIARVPTTKPTKPVRHINLALRQKYQQLLKMTIQLGVLMVVPAICPRGIGDFIGALNMGFRRYSTVSEKEKDSNNDTKPIYTHNEGAYDKLIVYRQMGFLTFGDTDAIKNAAVKFHARKLGVDTSTLHNTNDGDSVEAPAVGEVQGMIVRVRTALPRTAAGMGVTSMVIFEREDSTITGENTITTTKKEDTEYGSVGHMLCYDLHPDGTTIIPRCVPDMLGYSDFNTWFDGDFDDDDEGYPDHPLCIPDGCCSLNAGYRGCFLGACKLCGVRAQAGTETDPQPEPTTETDATTLDGESKDAVEDNKSERNEGYDDSGVADEEEHDIYDGYDHPEFCYDHFLDEEWDGSDPWSDQVEEEDMMPKDAEIY